MTALADALTLTRRNLVHLRRYPSLTLLVIAMPVVFLLLFVYVLGGTMGAGLPGGPGPDGARDEYLAYIAPAILVLTVAAVAQSTAILVAKDATEGIIDRFRTMPISRSAPVTSHVVTAMAQTLAAVVVVLVVAVLLGYRPSGSIAGWAGAAAVVVLLGLAVTWLCVALGLASGSVEAASNVPMPLILLPFLSSGFVPTDSMPAWLGWIAEHQPFTPVIDTLRACLDGSAPGADAAWAAGWCVVVAAGCAWWAVRRYGQVRTG